MARIGIYGGSFNPPHLGHVLAAKEFCQKLNLDKLLVIPAAEPPHKQLSANSPTSHDRLLMSRLAFGEIPQAEISDMELMRTGPSYTADTLGQLKGEYSDDELFLLMGTDMFFSFEKWYHPEEITKLATVVVAHRSEDNREKLLAHRERLTALFGGEILFVENEFLPYSSTATRAMLAFGFGEDYLPVGVHEYILSNHLYLTGNDLRNLPFEILSEISLSLHKSKRVPHIVGCSETAAELARRFGADPVAAGRAGILHDITKALGAEEQLKLCDKCDILVDNFQRSTPKLLHAKSGAAIAERVFGESPEVCEAIFWHTTGRKNMSVLEKIIYLADYIEPNRDFDGVEELRRLAYEDLDAAMIYGLEMTISYVSSRGGIIDRNSAQALRFFKERMQ